MRFFRKIKASFKKSVVNDLQRSRKQMIILLLVLGVISGGMSIVNVITKQHGLLVATSVFCIFSLGSSTVAFLDKNGTTAATTLFSLEIMALFTYFIISGGTQGFSTIWLLLLPACGMFAFGIKKGSILSSLLLFELVFFFYLPAGRSLLLCKDYTQAFLLRFPFVYVAFWMIGIFLELVRHETYAQLLDSREKYQFLSGHDVLTSLYNRYGFNKELDHAVRNYAGGKSFALMIIDIDHFKNVNDTYGHMVGDIVLRSVAKTIADCLQGKDAVACRWGGEEFAVLLYGNDSDDYCEIGETIRTSLENTIHDPEDNVRITVSIGAVHSGKPELTTVAQIVLTADRMLYQAKESGRNQVKTLKDV